MMMYQKQYETESKLRLKRDKIQQKNKYNSQKISHLISKEKTEKIILAF